MIWHFKTRTQIDIFEMRKMPSHVQHNAQTLHINVNIFNLATRVHMQPFHYNTCRFHNSLHMPQLVNGYTKLTIYIDRKSTRLNSSHVKISYAVFCLKKKNEKTNSLNHRCRRLVCHEMS